MAIDLAKLRLVASFGSCMLLGGSLLAAEYTAAEALRYQPSQRDVQYDRPDSAGIAQCTIKTDKTGHVVRDGNGLILRKFIDSNGDGGVDTYSYFKDGIEVYREIDLNNDQKPDHYRWLNTAGVRWGIDQNQDGKIDQWQTISPEEVTYEVVNALKTHDKERFERLLITPNELKALGLGKTKLEQAAKRLQAAPAGFATLMTKKGVFAADTKWVSFGGTQPGIVPAGTDDCTADLMVYENVAAMVETGGKPQAIAIGTLVRVKDTWRLIDGPQMSDDSVADNDNLLFFAVNREGGANALASQPNEVLRALMDKLSKLPSNDYKGQTAVLLELTEKAETPEQRAAWYKQLAETLYAAVQNGYTAGIDVLKDIHGTLKDQPTDAELAAMFEFRLLNAEHVQKLNMKNPDFARIQTDWIEDLQKFLVANAKYPDSADAMYELAIAQEFAGDDDKAIDYYQRIARDFPQAAIARKSAGARFRLDSVGKSMNLTGKQINAKDAAFDIKSLTKDKKAVLIQYTADWCDYAKADLPMLREMKTKYGKNFEIVSVSLDNNKGELSAFLKANELKWPVLYEDGGLDNRYANEMGIHTLPLMVLVDKQGKVVNRNVRAAELEAELKKILK